MKNLSKKQVMATNNEEVIKIAESNYNYLFNQVMTNNKEIADRYLRGNDEEKEAIKLMIVIGSGIMTGMQLSY